MCLCHRQGVFSLGEAAREKHLVKLLIRLIVGDVIIVFNSIGRKYRGISEEWIHVPNVKLILFLKKDNVTI